MKYNIARRRRRRRCHKQQTGRERKKHVPKNIRTRRRITRRPPRARRTESRRATLGGGLAGRPTGACPPSPRAAVSYSERARHVRCRRSSHGAEINNNTNNSLAILHARACRVHAYFLPSRESNVFPHTRHIHTNIYTI